MSKGCASAVVEGEFVCWDGERDSGAAQTSPPAAAVRRIQPGIDSGVSSRLIPHLSARTSIDDNSVFDRFPGTFPRFVRAVSTRIISLCVNRSTMFTRGLVGILKIASAETLASILRILGAIDRVSVESSQVGGLRWGQDWRRNR